MDSRARALVVITPEKELEGEIDALAKITPMLWRLHIRKPSYTPAMLHDYCQRLAQRVDVERLTIHYNSEIAHELGLGGVHLRETINSHLMQSTSCHSIEEVSAAKGFDYMFLSPIFDSISKKGYVSGFDTNTLQLPQGQKVVALGGITSQNIAQVAKSGFYSAALMGYIWGKDTKVCPQEVARRLKSATDMWQNSI